ncbi:MAG: helix-turn-helix transcriptional regulator [Nitrososphaerota archaeon]|nr:helix-turn-helix transcriptional regulator [Nitrososphaerota archaeon]
MTDKREHGHEVVDDSFNLSKAELFESLGHPTRIRLLQILGVKPDTFSELKRAAEIESNGLLAFHLGKLGNLVKSNPEGLYSLTDEGKEALRIVQATTQAEKNEHGSRRISSIFASSLTRVPHQKTILTVIAIVLVTLGILVGLVAGIQFASSPNAVIVGERITSYPVVTAYVNSTASCGALGPFPPSYSNSTSYVVTTARGHVSVTTYITTLNSTSTVTKTDYDCPYVPSIKAIHT